jgi:hypothetical protein
VASGGSIAERSFGSLFECTRVLLDARCSLVVDTTDAYMPRLDEIAHFATAW